MTFGLRADRFPSLPDYEAALRRHDSIKPKQGKNEGIRPLAERSRNSLNIRKVGEAEDLVIRLHGTDIITYRKNGEIVVNLGSWDTCTTHKTISAIAPCTLHRQYNQTWLAAKNGSYPIARRHDVVLMRGAMWNGEFLEFSRFSSAAFSPAQARYHYINPEYPTVHKLNRPVFNRIKKQHYQPFIDYIQTALSLRNNLAPTKDEAEAAVGEKYYEPMPLPDLMDLIHSGSLDNPESWYVASVVVLRRCISNAYRGWGDKEESVSLSRLKRELKDMICTHHRDEVFTSYEVRDGRVVKDVNAKYFM
jgi:hypothetical protein